MKEIFESDNIFFKVDRELQRGFPRVVAFVGPKGSGKKLFAEYVAEKLNATLVRPEDGNTNAEYLDRIIENAYKVTTKTLYLIPDLKSSQKKLLEKMLKVLEDVPNNAYFIITGHSHVNLTSAIKGRSRMIVFYPVSQPSLVRFAKKCGYDIDPKLLRICATYGDVIDMAKNTTVGNDEFRAYVEKVVDNIGVCEGANAFKIEEKVAFKEDDDGYNLKSFWIMFKEVCLSRAKEINNSKKNMYFSFIKTTTEFMNKLDILGMNKKALFDLWILEIRDTYFRYNK